MKAFSMISMVVLVGGHKSDDSNLLQRTAPENAVLEGSEGVFIGESKPEVPLDELESAESISPDGYHLHPEENEGTLLELSSDEALLRTKTAFQTETNSSIGCDWCKDSPYPVARDPRGNNYYCHQLGGWCNSYGFIRNNCFKTCGCWQFLTYSHGACDDADQRPIGSAEECRTAIAELSRQYYITRDVYHFSNPSHVGLTYHLFHTVLAWPKGCFIDVHGRISPSGHGPAGNAPYYATWSNGYVGGSYDYQLVCATRPPSCR